MSLALGKDHGGFVRAKGFGTTPTSYFNVPRRAKKDDVMKRALDLERKANEEQKRAYEAKIAAMAAKIQALETAHCSNNQDAAVVCTPSHSAGNYSVDEKKVYITLKFRKYP